MRPLLPLLALLCACASPGPEFFGAREHRITVAGTRIAVFHKGDAAQAIRLDNVWRRDAQVMRARLVTAITGATGCAVRPGSVSGDDGVIVARTDCSTDQDAPRAASG